ncbi:hypothetical protein BDF22DRAFT_677464 [Syncephalis plumigaleata]|nr:hypothetical protein BDF22DRAFT_677464 [Syncephalis plumigaleata]
MVQLFNILAIALAVPAVVLAQTNTTNANARPPNVSERCNKAMTGLFNSTACLKSLDAAPHDKLVVRCTSPVDSGSDHYCANEQVEKAMDVVENDCKAELDAREKRLLTIYGKLVSYERARKMECLKAPNGKYCFETMTNLTSQEREKQICQGCNKLAMDTWLSMQPSRSNNYSEFLFKEPDLEMAQKSKECEAVIKNTKKEEEASLTNSSNSMAPKYYTAFLAIVGVMMFYV